MGKGQWTLERKYEIGTQLFIDNFMDDVRRKLKAKFEELARKLHIPRVDMLLFFRETLYQVAVNLVRECETELKKENVHVEPLFPREVVASQAQLSRLV